MNKQEGKKFPGKDLKGFASFAVEKVSEEDIENMNLIDTSLQEVKLDKKAVNGAPLVREIYEFPQTTSLIPNFSYINNMYIYPIMANLSSKNGRNITVKMEVKDDDSLNSPGLNVIIIYSYFLI